MIKMRLTTSRLVPFLGGRAIISNATIRSMFRGEIKTLSIENGILKIGLDEAERYDYILEKWVKDELNEHDFNLKQSRFPEWEKVEPKKLCLYSPISKETITLRILTKRSDCCSKPVKSFRECLEKCGI